jgi:hypothetical protein
MSHIPPLSCHYWCGNPDNRGGTITPAAPNTGVNTLTGEGLAEVLQGAQVVVDVSNSPSLADDAVMEFFRTSTTNLLKAEKEAGVTHHVALSVVGMDSPSTPTTSPPRWAALQSVSRWAVSSRSPDLTRSSGTS